MRWSLAFALGLFMFCGSMTAEAGCPPWRPCGWGNSFGGNRLIPQAGFGADFRPACQMHDDCYANGCNRRIDCDRQFRANMHCACDCSRHPGLCRMQANGYYVAARVFGGLMR